MYRRVVGSKHLPPAAYTSVPPMVHPVIRILVALLMAVWMPLCCCQAALLVGVACNVEQPLDVATAQPDSSGDECCHRCQVAEPTDLQNSPDSTPPSSTTPCKSCDLCKRAIGSGLDSTTKLTRAEQADATVPTITFVSALPDTFVQHAASSSSLDPRYSAPPHVRANRSALRWHCALMV